MAGEGRKVFSDGEVLSAADVNDYLMDQAVMRFADSAARSSAIGTPTEGMVTYLDDVNQIEVYDGTAWVDQQAPILSEGTAGQYLQSNGTAGSVWVTSPSPDDLITTEGDLIVGGTGGTAQRLSIGADTTVLTSDGTAVSWAAAGGGGGFDTIDEITTSNSSYDVSGIIGIVKITVVGGGAGGAGGDDGFGLIRAGNSGGSSSVLDGGTTLASAAGGTAISRPNDYTDGFNATSALHAGNYGGGGQVYVNRDDNVNGADGQGGEIKIIYTDLTSISTLDITIGAGGTGGAVGPGNGASGGDGFRGVVLIERAS